MSSSLSLLKRTSCKPIHIHTSAATHDHYHHLGSFSSVQIDKFVGAKLQNYKYMQFSTSKANASSPLGSVQVPPSLQNSHQIHEWNKNSLPLTVKHSSTFAITPLAHVAGMSLFFVLL